MWVKLFMIDYPPSSRRYCVSYVAYQWFSGHLYRAHRAIIFAIVQLSCLFSCSKRRRWVVQRAVICVAYRSMSSSSFEQFPLASPSARLISRSVRHDLAPMRHLRACASYQLTPGAVFRVFLPEFWRVLDYYVDETADVHYAGASLSRIVFNSSMLLAVASMFSQQDDRR